MTVVSRPEIRTGVYDLLTDRFAAHDTLSAVTVHRQDGGDERGTWSVTLGNMTGPRSTTAFGGGTVVMNDNPTLRILIEVREAEDAETGDDICQQIADECDAALFTKPNVDLLNVALHPGELEGPNPYRSESGGAYLISAAVLTVEIIHTPRS